MLSYWQGKKAKWLKLSQCVKWLLSTPAMNTLSECTISLAGTTLDDSSSKLNIDTALPAHQVVMVVNNMLLMNDWFIEF